MIVCTASVLVPVRADEPPLRPIAVWPAGPLEVVAAFEQPVSRGSAEALVGKSIAYCDTSASEARAEPRSPLLGQLRIAAARLADDNRTLVLATDPHPRELRATCYRCRPRINQRNRMKKPLRPQRMT